MADRFVAENRELWDAWTKIHEASEFYDLESFVDGTAHQPPHHAPGVRVRSYEVADLGDVAGKDLLHVQCHFGIDTLSWARLGARVTGLDISPEAIALAGRVAERIGIADARFVESSVAEARTKLERDFDVVYTSRGVLWWMPDLTVWAETVAHFVRPGGVFYLTEFHPIVSVFDESEGPARWRVHYPYFPRAEPQTFEVRGSYADREAGLEAEEHGWNHGVAAVVQALVDAGLVIEVFREQDRTDFPQLPFFARADDGTWGLPPEVEGELPLMYTVRARKPA